MERNAISQRALPQGQASFGDTKLRWLIRLRWVLLALALGMLPLAHYMLEINLPLVPMLSVIAMMALFNRFSTVRLERWGPLRSWELFGQLLVDLLALTALLYLSGGSANPFLSMLVVPIAMAAVVTPGRPAWGLALLAVSCVGFLTLYESAPLNVASPLSDAVDLEMAGLWACFALSTTLIAYFVFGASQALRRTEQLLAETREQGLRNEYLAELGTLATGTAHELGTPLSTMAVVLGDLVKQNTASTELHTDLVLLKDQVYRCKDILSQLTCATGVMRAEAGMAAPAEIYLKDLLGEWQRRRPGVALTYTWQSETPGPRILTEQTLSQALLNLVDNAADVSPESVEINACWQSAGVEIEILDRGQGIPEEVKEKLGKEPVGRKLGGGMGIGVLLSQATVTRLGGILRIEPRDTGGTRCVVSIPVSAVSVDTEQAPDSAKPLPRGLPAAYPKLTFRQSR